METFKWHIVSQEEACEIFTAGNEVYLLYDDGSESLVKYVDDILDHCGFYGVEEI